MLGDTIVALASAPGTSERAVLRISGPRAFDAAALVFTSPLPERRATVEGTVRVRAGEVPAMALCFAAPASFTGENVVELHVPGGPLLVRSLQEDLLRRGGVFGVRAALAGEFTARACQNGRLDLAQAEGVLMLLHAADRQQAAAAIQWLRGGLSGAVAAVRSQLQDVLALIEAGLDFSDGDTGALAAAEWSGRLAPLERAVRSLIQSVPATAPGGEVLLLGAANVGKSSLCNALAGRRAALVADMPGTTRDLLRIEVAKGVAVWDAPGDLAEPGVFDAAALALRDRLAGRAAAVIGVLDATEPRVPQTLLEAPLPLLAIVWTRCDLRAPPPGLPPELAARLPAAVPILATSARTGEGIAALRQLLAERAHSGAVGIGAPLREPLLLAADAIARAQGAAAQGAELVAFDLQQALRAIDEVEGSHSPEQLLDRIYGRFCLGK